MSFESFDDPELDSALASGLSSLAPDVPVADVALAEMLPRFQRARTRRRVVQASSALGVLLLLGGVAYAEAPSARHSQVTVEAPAQRPTTTTAPKRTTTTHKRRTPKTTTVPTTAPPPTNPSSSSSSPHWSPSSGVSVSPTAPPATQPPTTAAPTPTTRKPTVATTVPASTTRRYYSYAGSVVVRLEDGKMSLLHVSPGKGYGYYVAVQRSLHIVVRFTRHSHTVSTVELVVINGRIRQIKHSVFATDQDVSSGWSRVSAASSSDGHGSGCDHSHTSNQTTELASGPHDNSGHSGNTNDTPSNDGSAA